jgi:hypothetical protein
VLPLTPKLLVATASLGLLLTHFVRQVAHHDVRGDRALKVDFVRFRSISSCISLISVSTSSISTGLPFVPIFLILEFENQIWTDF